MRRPFAAAALALLAACDTTFPWTGGGGPSAGGGDPAAETGTLAVAPASLQVTGQPGGLAPAARTLSPSVNVQNGTPSTSVYLSLSFAGAAVADARFFSQPGGAHAIEVVFPPPGPAAQVRTGTVSVSACFDDRCTRHLQGSPFAVPVTFTTESALAAEPASVTASWTRGEPVAPLPPILLTEPGVAAGSATASVTYAGASGWLTADAVPVPGSAHLALSPAGLPAGVHRATVRYASATSKRVDVPVAVTVLEPLVSADPGALAFTGVIGAPPPPSQATALAGGAVPVTYATTVQYGAGASGWLALPATVTPPQALALAPTTTALPAGTYTATVRFSGGDAVPRGAVTVTYTVIAMTLVDPADATVTVIGGTTAGDLAGTTPVTVSAGPALAWTAQGDAAWLILDAAGGTTGQAVAWHVDPAVLAAMRHGESKVATVTVATASPALSQAFTVTLRHRLPEVRFVAPSVQPAGQPARVRVRGAGFGGISDLASLQPVEGLNVAVTRVSDTALVLDLPAAAAGQRAVRVPNALGLTPLSATLHHVAPVAATYQKVAQAGAKRALLHDARRHAALAVNADAGQVVRFGEADGTWSAAVRAVAGIQDLGLSPDGELLVAVTTDQVRLLDPVTLADLASYAPPGRPAYSSMSESHGLAVLNDGRVLMPASSGWSFQLTTFDLWSRTFGALAVAGDVSLDLYSGPWFGASRDGERVLVVQSASISPSPPLLYADAADGVARRNPAGLSFFYQSSLSDDGSRFILHAQQVHDGAFGQVGRVALPATHPYGPGAAMSPDGQRAYVIGYVSDYRFTTGVPARVFVLDASAPPVGGTDLPILRTFDVPDHVSCPTDAYGCQYRVQVAVSPDETALFVLGQQGLLVVPIPPP